MNHYTRMEHETGNIRVRALLRALAVLPFAFLVAAMCRYHLDFPYLDQWELAPLLEKSYSGHVTLADLWAQHNEHRLVFPRAIMLLFAHASHWDVRWELAFNVLLGVGIFGVFARLLRETERAAPTGWYDWLLPATSLLVFSMSQWENWLLGWQLQELLNALAVAAGLAIAGRAQIRPAPFVWALCLGVVATYSFANGLLYWPIGLVTLAAAAHPNWRAARGWLAAWALFGGAITCSYLYHYHAPAYHPSLWAVFERPLEFALYVLKYLGAPIANFNGAGAAVAGAVGMAAYIGLIVRIRRAGSAAFAPMIPFAALALYAVASAVITGVGRTGFGSDQAMSPRYVTYANFLWLADFALAAQYLAALACGASRRRIVVGLAALCVFLLACCNLYGTYRWTERYHYRMEARPTLLSGNDRDMLGRIHPEPRKIIERRPILEKRGLSIFEIKGGRL